MFEVVNSQLHGKSGKIALSFDLLNQTGQLFPKIEGLKGDSSSFASEAMRKIGLALASSDTTEYSTIDSLRRSHPEFELHPLYKAGDWFKRGFNDFDSPTFMFLVNGKQIAAVTGFGPNLLVQFCDGLNKIGYRGDGSCTAPETD